jgi:bifunctional DNA-binding transcriptional regulator/antitoxin component of YhaV-PrlF toxin-antitoxin module
MKTNTIKMSRQGQITIPIKIRKYIPTSLIQIEIDSDKNIKILPIQSAAGSLQKYSHDTNDDFSKIRQRVWQESTKKFERKAPAK